MPKGRTRALTEGILGQHLALSVAAHLARTQLVPDPLRVYDSQHLLETIDAVARALAKVAQLYVRDEQSGQPRELSALELEGAAISRGATALVLKDGRTLGGVTMKRADLRQAIAIFKALGIEELSPRPALAGAPQPNAGQPDRLACVAELESLLEPPLVPAQVERANRLLVRLAREAPHGQLSNLAMRLMSAVQEAGVGDEAAVRAGLARLRAALEDLQRADTP